MSTKTESALFLGRFQPFTKAHASIATDYSDSTVIVIVRGKNDKRSPFPMDLTERIIKDSLLGNALVTTFNVGYVPDIIKKVQSDFDVLIKKVLAGSDRVSDYKRQLASAKMADVEVEEIKRADDDISASIVRKAIIDDDYLSYKRMMCNGAHRYFHELQTILQGGQI